MVGLALGLASLWPHGGMCFAVSPRPNTCTGVWHGQGRTRTSPVSAHHQAKQDTAAFDGIQVSDQVPTFLESTESLDSLIRNVRELELEVEELQKGEDEIEIRSCRFAREGVHQEPAKEGRDVLLLIPGVDGLNMEAVDQFDILSASFDVWSMRVRGNDQSTFVELTEQVMEFMEAVGVSEKKQAVIVGSSFGGLLAVNVAQQDVRQIKGIVLVNPATSYDRSNWRVMGSLVANAPGLEAFGVAATLTLATTVPDTAMVSRYMREFEALPPQEIAPWFKSLTDQWLGRISGLFDKTPQEQLRWRLENWLEEGGKVVEPLLPEVTLPVLVLAGSEDHMLPSVDEAGRLYDIIPTCQQVILRGVGHAALHNPGEVNLCALLQSSIVYDERLRDRVIQSKQAKKSSKRWKKDDSPNQGQGVVDPVLDFTLDMDDDLVKLAWESTQAMDRFTSPVFLSVNERGELQEGLGGVPDHKEGRSIIFVGNHQLLGIDMPILVRKIIVEKDICVRGLAHPVVSGAGTERFMDTIKQQEEADRQEISEGFGAARRAPSSVPSVVNALARRLGAVCVKTMARGVSLAHRVVRRGQKDLQHSGDNKSFTQPALMSGRVGEVMGKLGAVPVTPRNMYRLVKAGEAVLLYPGGAKEALHQKGQEYQMFWPEKSEFVRIAASCNASIVPFAAVGSADSIDIWADLEEIFSLPFGVGEKMREAGQSLPRARRGDDLEYFLPPIARPKVPARHYFVFGQEIPTSNVNEKDREACQAVYEQTRSSVAGGIRYLLSARQHDPYGDGAKRILYETVMRTRAPTFPLDAADFSSLRRPAESACTSTAGSRE